MSNYHTNYDSNKKHWKVNKAGGKRASRTTKTQKEAEKIAKELCGNSGGGEVVIHRKDNNRIRDKDTVAPGNESSYKDTKF